MCAATTGGLSLEGIDVAKESVIQGTVTRDGEPGQLLERVEHLTVVTHEVLDVATDDAHEGAVTLDVHVDVAVEVGDVQQALEVVGGDVALALEVAHRS